MVMLVDRFRYPPEHPMHARARRSMLGDLFDGGGAKLRAIGGLVGARREIARAYRAFEDAPSRAVFRDLLVYRHLTPHLSKLANDRRRFAELEAFMAETIEPEGSGGGVEILGEPLAVWPARYAGVPVRILTSKYGLYWTVCSQQYYFRRGAISVAPEAGDVILDCGAMLGDTAIKLAVHAGETGRVYSFDPSPVHVRLARRNVARNQLGHRIEVFPCGVAASSRPGAAEALSSGVDDVVEDRLRPGRPLGADDAAIAIDDFCRLRGLAKVDYIKMDIEGSEAAALAGAEETIRKHRPKLAVCLYHRPEELWTIPADLKRRFPFYRLYLAHHSLHSEETVLYARA